MLRFLLLVPALALFGCYEDHGLRGAAPEAPDAGPAVDCVEVPAEDPEVVRPEKVDLLLMVDNSNSMNEEQGSLARSLPGFVRALVSGDADLDGRVDFAPVGSLHVAVVTSDMGTGAHEVPTCEDVRFGDDGVMRPANTTLDGCAPDDAPFLTFEPGGDESIDAFAARAACRTTLGTGGCGFEQQLEAALKAITPSTSPIRFFGDTVGHGDGVNAGFLRDDSILAVVVVTDEDDCSARDPDLFDPDAFAYRDTELNLRCNLHRDALYGAWRYVAGLISLREREPGRLVYATIAGIPSDLSGEPEAVSLLDLRLEERVNPDMRNRLLPSCDVTGRGEAFPPRRLLEVGQRLREAGARTTHISICQDDFSPAVALVLEEIRAAARPVCE